MRIAIIGAGFTGLTAAYYLSKEGHNVTVIERENYTGGLATGFREHVDDYPEEWDWDIERFYHHWFTNDVDVFQLIDDLGVKKKLLTLNPKTASLFGEDIYQIDSPKALLQLPILSPTEKVRMAIMLAFFKLIPNGTFLERWTAHHSVKKFVGAHAYELFWEPLLKGKFDNYYKDVNLAWLWARIYKRTPKLAYFEGGFQALTDILTEAITQKGGIIKTGTTVQNITQDENTWTIKTNDQNETFDAVLCTTPPGPFFSLFPQLPQTYRDRFNTKLNGIGAHAVVLALDKKFFVDDTYWLSIHNTEWPFLIIAEHTNFVSNKHYDGKHILYVGDYLNPSHPNMQLDKNELLDLFVPFMQKLHPGFSKENILHSWLWRAPFAQPIVPINHSKNIPPFDTPLHCLYFASMSQVYPWDRGTNYAVKAGKDVATTILQKHP